MKKRLAFVTLTAIFLAGCVSPNTPTTSTLIPPSSSTEGGGRTTPLAAFQENFVDWVCERATCEINDGLRLCGNNEFVGAHLIRPISDGKIELTWEPNRVGQSNNKQFYLSLRRDKAEINAHTIVFAIDDPNQIRFKNGLSGTTIPFRFEMRPYRISIVHEGGRVTVGLDGHVVAEATYPADEGASQLSLTGSDDGSCHTVRDVRANDTPIASFAWKCLSPHCRLDSGLHLCANANFAAVQSAFSIGNGKIHIEWNPNRVGEQSWKELYVTLRPTASSMTHRIVFSIDDPSRIRFDHGLSGEPISFEFQPRLYNITLTHVHGVLDVELDGRSVGHATFAPSESASGIAISGADDGSCHTITRVSYESA